MVGPRTAWNFGSAASTWQECGESRHGTKRNRTLHAWMTVKVHEVEGGVLLQKLQLLCLERWSLWGELDFWAPVHGLAGHARPHLHLSQRRAGNLGSMA